jgi:hypothetical protein
MRRTLRLHRESLRTLTAAELGRAAGGTLERRGDADYGTGLICINGPAVDPQSHIGHCGDPGPIIVIRPPDLIG